MGTYKSSTSKRIFRNYKSVLERAVYEYNKNFSQMDFENADAREEIREHVEDMIKSCQKLVEQMNGYTFY